ncbi:7366_t:CDS:2, partial [Ambispora gerdemannii]
WLDDAISDGKIHEEISKRESIGEGSSGKVYLAECSSIAEKIVLKNVISKKKIASTQTSSTSGILGATPGIFWEISSCRIPFEGLNRIALMNKISNELRENPTFNPGGLQ